MKKTLIIFTIAMISFSVDAFSIDSLIAAPLQYNAGETAIDLNSPILLPENTIVNENLIPWAKNGSAMSEFVIQRGEYSLWKVNEKQLKEIPSCTPVGIAYHYFVFKNGEFLFTVNECNKDKVYQYFTNQT